MFDRILICIDNQENRNSRINNTNKFKSKSENSLNTPKSIISSIAFFY